MSAHLTPEDFSRIESAIREAENRTSAEFRVGVVPQSAFYGEWRALGAALLTFTVSVAAYLFLPTLPLGQILIFQPLVALVAWIICGAPQLLLVLAPDEREKAAVLARAKVMFFDVAMRKTSAHTGVLFFLSLLEHRVHILVDTKVAEILPDSELQPYVETIVRSAGERRIADGVCQVLEQLSVRLSGPLPTNADRRNELPDAVKVET